MTMKDKEQESAEPTPEIFYDLTSTQDAAKLLRVSESTVWRWINQEKIPAYKVGSKRVWLRRSELESLIRPARKRKEPTMERKQMLTLPMSAFATGDNEAVARARALQASLLAKRGGKPMPEAWQDIDEAREQRSQGLD